MNRRAAGPPLRIISGGQTGVDRAALDVALELGLPCGGWCPRGRKAEDGSLADRYPLVETATADYSQRTLLNVRDSDGTLILMRGQPTGGTALTITLARKLKKPALVLDLGQSPRPATVRDWLETNRVRVLNVAGPRESTSPRIYRLAKRFLKRLLKPRP
jgi:hypothetical protein